MATTTPPIFAPAFFFQVALSHGRLCIVLLLRECALSAKGNIEANDGETLGQLAANGAGIARVGRFSIAEEPASGRLVPILEACNSGYVEMIHAVFVGGAGMPARVRLFVDFLADRLR